MSSPGSPGGGRLEQLSQGEQLDGLAALRMSFPAASKHAAFWRSAGTTRVGRTHFCRIEGKPWSSNRGSRISPRLGEFRTPRRASGRNEGPRKIEELTINLAQENLDEEHVERHDVWRSRNRDNARFNAPRHLVWNAVTKPELLKRWLIGPPGWEIDQFEDDVRAGGKFRWSWRGPDGAAMAMSGVYKEVVPPERVVRTESFEFGCVPQAGEQISSMVLTEKRGVTTLTLTVLYPSKEARDGRRRLRHGTRSSVDTIGSMKSWRSVRSNLQQLWLCAFIDFRELIDGSDFTLSALVSVALTGSSFARRIEWQNKVAAIPFGRSWMFMPVIGFWFANLVSSRGA